MDEWDFLTHRGVRFGKQGLFYPHNEHWSTIPILIWRALFNLVGVRDYWLYALPLILAHLAVAHLVWRLMLRHNVEPWTATLVTGTFVVLGVGWLNVTSAFQIGFVGSVAFGLLAVQAIEDDRLWLPAVWGICALMCSDIGVPMVVACGLVALASRKPRLAAYSVLPPAFVFLIWYVTVGHEAANSATHLKNLTLDGLASYVWTGLKASMGGYIDSSEYVGAVLVSVLAGAAVVRRNVPAALAASTLALYAFVGFGRLHDPGGPAPAGRYAYVALALLLPLVGQLVSLLMRNHEMRPLVMSGLLLLVGANVVLLHKNQVTWQRHLAENDERSQMQAAAYLIHIGERFPGQFFASSICSNIQCVDQDVPDMSTLTTLVRRNEFPVPTSVASSDLRSERALLGVFASPKRGYSGDLTFVPSRPSPCAMLRLGRSVSVDLRASGSLELMIAGQPRVPILLVSFPGVPSSASASVIVAATSADRWLNLASGAYPTAVITSFSPARVCEITTR
ncbi:MAG TPA: hypothetical protein VMU64_13520 [Acidimicrobiales bacterium]|nr:hypothetical protein [Acidimicrobiales bacterium]